MISNNLISLCERSEKYKRELSEYLKNENPDIRDRDQILCKFMLDPNCTKDIADCFPQYIQTLLCKSVIINLNKAHTITSDEVDDLHKLYCVILGKLILVNQDVKSFLMQYFDNNPAPFEIVKKVKKSKSKKIKLDIQVIKVSHYDIVLTTYNILKSLPFVFKTKWRWSKFYEYLNIDNDEVKWVALKCLKIVFNMSEVMFLNCVSDLIKDYQRFYMIDEKEYAEHSSKYNNITQQRLNDIVVENNPTVVDIAGIPLLVVKNKIKSKISLVQVPSLKANLRNVAIGVATGKCICLQGPVGCGKTAVVEHLAKLTGHYPNNFVKVQLGDQTDSKMLLGMYVCTDIPGEFIWQPGVLTEAVTEGKWLLLEDIDCAPLDVCSVLCDLLETGTLSVPGYRDTIRAKVGFQLFITQRLVTSASGLRKQTHSGATSLLNKQCLYVNMEQLSQNELIEVVQTLFPHLHTIASKMVNVFLWCSEETDNTSLKSGRLTSTRDLIKWCLRIKSDFDISSPVTAAKIFQDAMDIFCSSIPNQEDRLKLAIAIGHILGQTTSMTEYFFNNYKPTIEINNSEENFIVGRTILKRKEQDRFYKLDFQKTKFSYTRPSACLLERVATSIAHKEPVLLVGETGTGKTSSVQYLAHKLGHKLIVLNMNQQSESSDLLGGYKPIDLKFCVTPIREEYEILFRSYFVEEQNKEFLSRFAQYHENRKWKILVKLMFYSTAKAVEDLQQKIAKHVTKTNEDDKKKDLEWFNKWQKLAIKLDKLMIQVKAENSLAFTFIEGSLVKALKEGYWVLLDEINLANAETLECLSGLLDGSSGSLSLLERGDKEMIRRHPNFTIFACMNPATDVGKKELPVGLRNRFTEFFVDELSEFSDLHSLINTYLGDLKLSVDTLKAIVKLYLNIRKESMITLCDGIGHKPHFSLRTLCRALNVTVSNPCGSVLRSLYEGFCLSFLTQLDDKSYPIVKNLILKAIMKTTKNAKSILGTPILKPINKTKNEEYINFEGYWIVKGSVEPDPPKNYILTPMVRQNLKDLARIVSIGKMPVLLQGDTSVGKTSLIMYLAKSSGHSCVRINNHEHTDLQEYVGSYVVGNTGKLVFKEGILVEAMRKGYWIILDELNLAPSDVLEALNRVLDDNHELFIPETQTVVKAHQNFMLFATQNPPGVYGGRKVLSRAFRNRFVELHFDEIPTNELQVILHERCSMPESYCKQIISVTKDLQIKRKSTDAFAGKQGFVTLRDLFRWGERYRLAPNQDNGKLYDWNQHLADEGFLVLAAKVRRMDEVEEIREAIKKHLKRDVDPDNLFNLHDKTSLVTRPILQKILDAKHKIPNLEHIVFTYEMRKMAVLVLKSFQFKEPVLLVGETGGGKTTICQLVSVLNEQIMFSINCHMHIESSDFLGNLRPIRNRTNEEGTKLFEWVNGPLIEAMQNGGLFLADEISLADDSVLERLNSLLEPERSLLLTERGFDGIDCQETKDVIVANEKFFFIGTMNPGGDFGKKELSPALRNRFTEIWCPSCTKRDDLISIAEHNLTHLPTDARKSVAIAILNFVQWLTKTDLGKKFVVSIRDILTWVQFINTCTINDQKTLKLSIRDAYLHGAYLTYIDGFGSGLTSDETATKINQLKDMALKILMKEIEEKIQIDDTDKCDYVPRIDMSKFFGLDPFYIKLGPNNVQTNALSFTFEAETTKMNMLKVLRALQLDKPLLLEGSPGVGKTSLVAAIAKASGNNLLRINLSDQTDMSDLFGADLPIENGKAGEFAWRDGPFLRALQAADWILLDELNLASQSVLEGLNACFDHRGEVYIPELNKTFQVKPGTKFFGCINPLKEGGGRRGLPKSFLNRFTQVFVDVLSDEDLRFIVTSQFPEMPCDMVNTIIKFNSKLAKEAGTVWGHSGSPWEMNLRDVTRWCQAIVKEAGDNGMNKFNPGQFVELIYSDRMRTFADKEMVRTIYREMFSEEYYKLPAKQPIIQATFEKYLIGDTVLMKNNTSINSSDSLYSDNLLLLRDQMPILRSLARCVNMNWMAIVVGRSGSGKTNVVRTLAKLAGQSLRSVVVNSAMDTTEILGSFEQTNYNRHLEEHFEFVEEFLINEFRTNFKVQDLTQRKLLQKLEETRELFYNEKEATTSMSAATEYFLFKANELLNLIKLVQSTKVEYYSELNKIKKKLSNLISVVKRDGCLNACGKFEWVDSLLVKCLQEGSWLLIDQVNLCNPAVLDRLNGLLEPNGVLSIGERGVNPDGTIVTIKPHENFRLFLTMDPKYGEISRAMRNRGLEIYILSSTENITQNPLDLRSMLYNIGLTKIKYQNVLLKVHNEISEHPLTVETLTVSHLMHAGFLFVQQISRGFSLKEAFSSACVDVYVKSRLISDITIRQSLINIVEEVIKSCIEPNCESYDRLWDSEIIHYETITHCVNDLQENPQISFVKQNGFILQWVINVFKTLKVSNCDYLNEFFDVGSDFNNKIMSDIKTSEILPYLVLQFYEASSLNTIEIQRQWLDKIIGDNNLDLLSIKKQNDLLSSEIKKFKFNESKAPELLWDCSHIGKTEQNAVNEANRLALLLHYCVTDYTSRNCDFNITNYNFSKPISVVQYSKAINEGKIMSKTEDNHLITHFYTLITSIKMALLSMLRDSSINVDNEKYALFRTSLQCVHRFESLGETHLIKSNSSNTFHNVEQVSLLLKVYYKWMIKTVLNFISDHKHLLYNECKIKVNESLNMINYINTHLKSINDPFRKVSKLMKNALHNIPPHSDKEIMEVHFNLQNLTEMFKPYLTEIDEFQPKQLILNLLQETNDLNRTISDLVNLWQELYLEKSFDQCTLEKLEQIHNFIKENLQKQETDITSDIQVWPLYEYLFLIFVSAAQSDQSNLKTLNFSILDDYIKQNILSTPVNIIALLNILNKEFNCNIENNKRKLDMLLFYSFVRSIQNMYITKTELSTLHFENKIYINSLHGFNLINFILQFLLTKSTVDLTALNLATATLGSCNTRISNLKMVNQLLWSNCAALNSPALSYEINDFHLLKTSANSFLVAIESANNSLKVETDQSILQWMNNDYFSPLEKFKNSIKNLSDANLINQGESWFLLGYLEVFLFSNIGFIDPVHKVSLKLQNIEEEINDIRKSIYISVLTSKVQGLQKNEHPRILELEKYAEIMTKRINDLNKFKAYRPENKEFLNLCKAMTDFRAFLGKFDIISKYIENLFNAVTVADEMFAKEEASRAIEEAVVWQDSTDRFVEQMERLYLPSYPDIVMPVIIGLIQMKHGLNLLIDEAFQKVSSYSSRTNKIDLQTFIYNSIQFPSIGKDQKTLLSLVKICTSYDSRELLNKNMVNVYDEFESMQEQFRVTMSALREFYNHVILQRQLSKESWNILNYLLHQIILIWNQQQRKIHEQESMKNSLYKNKAVVHSETESEEEILEKEIKYLFPTSKEEDFGDIESLTNVELGDTQQKLSSTPSKKTFVISESHMHEVQTIHSSIVTRFTTSTWLSKKPSGTPNYIEPLIQRFNTCNILLKNTLRPLSSEVSLKLIPSLNILTEMTLRASQGQSLTNQEKMYDFYRDSNVEEVKKGIVILKRTLLRVNELLEQWPEHPTLISINVIIKRLFDFPVASSISRFLTGFELLLTKLNEWEENAHKGVSLFDYSTILTQQIISWRKYELACWKDCLNITKERLRLGVYKWWFHLYSLFEKYTTSSDDAPNQTKMLIESLQKFMNESSLVEFESRLELLFIFHCHLCFSESSDEQKELLSVLWNLHKYYSLLLPQVNARIDELKSPIQKGLKDFVKIARWNDISYWSVTETIHKTHKTLHSFIKKFETGLKESVVSCFFIKPTFEVNNGSHSFKSYLNVDEYLVSAVACDTSVYIKNDSIELLKNIESKCKISRKLCREIINKSDYVHTIHKLEDFIQEFMELSLHLKNSEIDKTLSKPSQKSLAKSIFTQKKTSLARYFKELKDFGVSDRKGILTLKNKESEVICLTIAPIDPVTSLNNLDFKSIDQRIQSEWNSGDTYYYKSIHLLNTLNTSSYPAQKGLSSQDIEKFKGFSADLMIMAHNQRRTFVDSWKHFIFLRKQLCDLSKVDKIRVHLFEKFEVNVKLLSELLITAKIIFDQLALYIQSCPESTETERVYNLLKSNTKITNCNKYDSTWNEANSLIDHSLNLISQISKQFDSTLFGFQINENDPANWLKERLLTTNHSKCLSKCFNTVKQLQQGTLTLLEMFAHDNKNNHPVTSSIDFLKQLINEYIQNYELLNQESCENKIEDCIRTDEIYQFELNLEEFIKRLLLIVQNKFKANMETDAKYLSEKLVKHIMVDIQSLQLNELVTKFSELLSFSQKGNQNSIRYCSAVLSSCMPLVEQYLALSEYYLTEQIASLRVTSKMLYLQLNVFLELATNGFCIPKDIDIDEENDDESGNNNKGGMGLADGEGEKDVSERIENEDQLDDAKLPGQEKENNPNNDNCKEEEKGINMSEDFDAALQDIEKPENEEGNESDNDNSDNEDLDKQMDELGADADKLDEEIWKDDNDEDVSEDDERKDTDDDIGKGEQIGDNQMDAKTDDKENGRDEKNENDECQEKEQPEKEINEMKEPEINEDQIDPYYNKQKEQPEIEPLDLPEDLNMDDDANEDEENQENLNPFDIDEMKKQMSPPEIQDMEEEDSTKDNENENKPDSDTEDEEDESNKDGTNDLMAKENSENEDVPDENREDREKKEKNEDDKMEEEEKSGIDEENKALPSVDDATNETDAAEQIDTETSGSKDSVPQKPECENKDPPTESSSQDNNSDKGTGQSEMENQDNGHSGSAFKEKMNTVNQQGNEMQKNEKRKNPGQFDDDRTLVNESDPVRKKLKTTILTQDKTENNEEDESFDENKESDTYQHVVDSQKCDQYAMDAATEDQMKERPANENENDSKENEDADTEMQVDEDDTPEDQNCEQINSEKSEQNEKKKSKKLNNQETKKETNNQENEDIELDGETVMTSTVIRNIETTFVTNLLKQDDTESLISPEQRRFKMQTVLQQWTLKPTEEEACRAWNTLNSIIDTPARHLSEKLRLILEPTQASRLKGDYRTGKRINMRKIIPYIASQFRKDKIWLRRTKPSKRNYQIVLAIDDSSSMADNYSKEIAFESLALISKALTYLEAGELSIMSFGETTNILHPLGEPFTDRNGSYLIQELKFEQQRTKLAQMVNTTVNIFESQAGSHENAKLLVILSDGRGVFSEGKEIITRAVRKAKLSDIFIVFIIADNPKSKDSILDIKLPIIKPDGSVQCDSYLETFPFPFYIILRDVKSLADVLSDALRQWFEVVGTNNN